MYAGFVQHGPGFIASQSCLRGCQKGQELSNSCGRKSDAWPHMCVRPWDSMVCSIVLLDCTSVRDTMVGSIVLHDCINVGIVYGRQRRLHD